METNRCSPLVVGKFHPKCRIQQAGWEGAERETSPAKHPLQLLLLFPLLLLCFFPSSAA
jgi:hypothetical protein